jgi:hypothetical protein
VWVSSHPLNTGFLQLQHESWQRRLAYYRFEVGETLYRAALPKFLSSSSDIFLSRARNPSTSKSATLNGLHAVTPEEPSDSPWYEAHLGTAEDTHLGLDHRHRRVDNYAPGESSAPRVVRRSRVRWGYSRSCLGFWDLYPA